MHQLKLIVDLLGSPNENIWPDYKLLPYAEKFTFKHQPYNNIKQKFPWLTPSGVRFLNNLFMFDPKKRSTADECLSSSYFCEKPFPLDKRLMPTFPEHRNFKRGWAKTPEETSPKSKTSISLTEKLKEHVKSKKRKKK